uniref:Serpentine receptor class gamma n=1 Tax=Globodera rostochiensis TaxID=31243 RepID=A0A914HST0_GLORO
MLDFAEWSNSIQNQIIGLTICITIPSMALYIAEIVTIVRHKKFHKSFYALFAMRAISDLLYVLVSFYGDRLPTIIGAVLYPIYSTFPNWMLAMFFFLSGHTFIANMLTTAFIILNRLTAIIMPIKHEKIWQNFLPFITIFVSLVPTLLFLPMFKMNAILILNDPNSTTDRSFIINEAGDLPYGHYLAYICAVSSVIFMALCVLLNIGTFVAYKLHTKQADTNVNNFNDIKKKLLVYAMATFLGHALVASLFFIPLIIQIHLDPKAMAMFFVYFPLVMDAGTVVLSSWLLLWASGAIRQQLIKDFTIIRKTNIQNNRVGPMDGLRNNNHRPVGGAVGQQFQSSVGQLPTVS